MFLAMELQIHWAKLLEFDSYDNQAHIHFCWNNSPGQD